MNLFIDTNVFLAFYHFSSDDLEELRKLVPLVNAKSIELFLPTQVIDEFRRNREAKIADAMKKLREVKFTAAFPQCAKSYAAYNKLRDLMREADKAHAELVAEMSRDASRRALQADSVIEALFGLGRKVDVDASIVSLARERVDRGNPPGKAQSLGDALNWEALLRAVPKGDDLVLVSDDRDYASPLDEAVLSPFLATEWRERKAAEIAFFRALSPFFKKHYPHITLASEVEKDLLIRDLAMSSTFARTHAVVAKLSNYSEFTASQLNAIVEAAMSNSQVSWIMTDPDVRDFLRSAIKGKEHLLEVEISGDLATLLQAPSFEDDPLF